MFEIIQVPDSFAWLRGIGDCQVDAVITDPPFNEHVHKNMTSGTAIKRQVESGVGGGIPKIDLGFSHLAGYEFAVDLVRISRRWAISFCAVEDFGAYRDAVGPARWVRGGIWIKPNAMGQLTGDRPASAYEGLAITHQPGKKKWNGKGSYAYWLADTDEFPSEESLFVTNGTRGEAERHPNQKSLRHCLELVAKFTDRGELVVDPFCGSGRIGEACQLLGRNYIGLDSDLVWVERARARCASVEFGSITDEACLRLCALPRNPKGAKSPAAVPI